MRGIAVTAGLALAALAVGSVAPALAGEPRGFEYSYVEIRGDLSRTANTSRGAAGNAGGNLVGLRGSLEVYDSLYLLAGYSTESKSFSNDVAGTRIGLDTTQTFFEVGAGWHWETGERTSLYAEALGLDTRVEHEVPAVTPNRRGPPTVSTRVTKLGGQGFGAGIGARLALGEDMEAEGRLGYVRIEKERELALSLAWRMPLADYATLGAYVSYATITDRNFDNITKLGLALRLH